MGCEGSVSWLSMRLSIAPEELLGIPERGMAEDGRTEIAQAVLGTHEQVGLARKIIGWFSATNCWTRS